MKVGNWLRAGILGLGLVVGARGAWADDDPQTVFKKREEIRSEIEKTKHELGELRKTIENSDDLAAERKARADVGNWMMAKSELDPKVRDSRKAIADAKAKLAKVETAEVEGNSDVRSAQKDADAANETTEDLKSQQRLNQVALEEQRKKAERDPEIKKLAVAAKDSGKGLEYFHTMRVQKNLEDAKRLLEDRKVNGNERAIAEAQKNYDESLKKSKELDESKAARDAAEKAYQTALKEKLEKDTDAAALKKKGADLESKLKDAEAAEKKAEQKLEEARAKALKDNANITAARKAVEDATAAEKKALDDFRNERKSESEAADKTLAAKVDAKMSSDAKATELKKKLEDLEGKLKASMEQPARPRGRTPATKPDGAGKGEAAPKGEGSK